MAQLIETLEPGEQVVLQVDGARIAALGWFAVGLAAVLSAVMTAEHFVASRPLSMLVFYAGLSVAFLMNLVARGNEAMVTDRRLLYRRGLFRRRVLEMPLAEIAALHHGPGGGLRLTGRSGETATVRAVNAPLELALAILRHSDAAAPDWLRDIAVGNRRPAAAEAANGA